LIAKAVCLRDCDSTTWWTWNYRYDWSRSNTAIHAPRDFAKITIRIFRDAVID